MMIGGYEYKGLWQVLWLGLNKSYDSRLEPPTVYYTVTGHN